MVRSNKSRADRIALAVFVVSLGWLTGTHADDRPEGSVRAHFATSPLTGALSQASVESGIPVPIASASGIATSTEPSTVGSSAPYATALASSPRALPDVAVATPRPPSEQELAGNSLSQFIVHHATVHYVNTGVTGNLAHWRGGRPQTVCPTALGLDPASNAFVAARIRALAGSVGAPVQSDPACQDNVRIIFTPEPEKIMADVVQWASVYFGVRYPSMRRLMMFRSGYAVQGWYFTAAGGSRMLNTDVALLDSVHVLPLWPQVIPSGSTDDGSMSGIVSVILVVDPTKVTGYDIGALADYLGVLALTVVQAPDHCDPLPSILDLMSPSCSARARPAAVTAGDLAFLKGLYYRNTGLGPSLSRSEIHTNMMRQFERQ